MAALTPAVLFARRLTSQTPPHTPTNRERLQAYRSRVEPVLANSHPWKWVRRN